MTTTDRTETPFSVDEDTVARYRRDGFVHVPGALTQHEVARYRAAAEEVYDHEGGAAADNPDYLKTFKQVFNVWRNYPVMRELTFNADVASIATQLAGVPLRLYQDHMLVKAPHNGSPTEFHQDAPYFPLAKARHILTAWIALVDVPVERGCMTFIPGEHHRRDLRRANPLDATDMFAIAADLAFRPRVTIPVRAGDVVLHHGYTPHHANANDTDEYRFAHAVVYFDRDAVSTDEGFAVPIGQSFPDGDYPALPR